MTERPPILRPDALDAKPLRQALPARPEGREPALKNNTPVVGPPKQPAGTPPPAL